MSQLLLSLKKIINNKRTNLVLSVCAGTLFLAVILLSVVSGHTNENSEKNVIETKDTKKSESAVAAFVIEDISGIYDDNDFSAAPNIIIETAGPAEITPETEEPVVTEEPVITEEPTATPEPTPVITIDYKDIEEKIDYETSYVPDASMKEGNSRTITEGEKGIITYVYEITYVDGKETSRKLVATKHTKDPVKKVVAYGTDTTGETFKAARGEKVAFTKCLKCEATAYSNSGWGDAIAYPNILGNGKRLTVRWGVIATDPSVIAPGTRVYIKGINGQNDYGYAIAADTGGSIINNRIDVYMNDASKMSCWGRRNVEVYILEDQTLDVFELRGDATWEKD